MRSGDQVQLSARVLDPAGNQVPEAEITWEVLGAGKASASVSSSGLVSFRQDTVLGGQSFVVRARYGQLADSVNLLSRDWNLVGIAGGSEVGLSPQQAVGTVHRPGEFVWVSCVDGTAVAALWVDGFGNGPSEFEYRFSGGEPTHAAWVYSANGFDVTVYAPGSAASRQFAERLLTSDTLYLKPPDVPERRWTLHAPGWLRERVFADCGIVPQGSATDRQRLSATQEITEVP